MWHEARRQEKILRTTMIDQSKRAERKRRYFENVRKDPEQFMQIHGRKAQIHADLAIARAAEDSNILRPWQGDPSITIDRFDVRSHLSKMDLMDDDDIIPKKKPEVVDEKEKIVTDFERFRVLIINDYKKVSEKSYLKKIADREYWCAEKDHAKKTEAEKKKKSAEKKSMIGFSYEDSEVVKGDRRDKHESDEESEEELDELLDLDVDLDTSILNPETQRTVNKSGEEFGVKRGLFCALLKADQQALRDAAQLKQIDRQKAQLSGRESKHERMLLRQQRQAIVGKKGMMVSQNGATATLLGFINKSQKKSKIDEIIEDMEGSDDDDYRRGAKPEFITTFGGGGDKDSDDEVRKNSVGPELPSEEYRKILKLSQCRRKDDDEKVDWGGLKVGGGNTETSRRSWNNSRSRSRTRSPPRRNRSRSRSRDRYRRRRSGSRRRSRSRDRDRKRSRSRDRRRSRSRDRRRSRSRDRRRESPRRRHRSRSTSRRRYRDRSREDRNDRRRRSESRERKVDVKSTVVEKVPEEKPPVKIDEPKESSAEESGTEDVKMLEIRSSMSDSEKEKIEIENRKRRVKLTKKLVKEKRVQASAADDHSSDEEDEEQQRRAEQARRVKQQMNQALKKTRQELAKEEEDRKREAIIAQKVRDELRYIEVQERRERERAKQRETDIPLPPSNSP